MSKTTVVRTEDTPSSILPLGLAKTRCHTKHAVVSVEI